MKGDRFVVALWVAFFAGLRREEIARLEWEDIDFAAQLVTVRKSKTGRRRVLPLAAKLAEVLQARKRKAGRVVPWPEEGDRWKHHALALLDRVGGDRAKWNVFRHTFASLLVQPPARVSIDTVAHWLGNTPEVCRRHYAQFLPRDSKDAAIDTL